jgi:hypothetical protein
MRYICTSIVAIASFCITGTSLGDFWALTPTQFNGQANYDFFGTSVAIDGDTCVIGAWGTNKANIGIACAYTSDANGTWNQVAEFNGEAYFDRFGYSVAIDGDTCVIGARGDDSYAGRAYVYTSDPSGTWNQVAEFNGNSNSELFGTSVAIDGDTCVIGARGTNSNTGSAYVYSKASGTWSQVAELSGEAIDDYFGRSVAIDGDTCVIGASGTNSNTGSAYVYSKASGTWNQVAELSGEAYDDYFGNSVAIDGDTCVIGASGTNSNTGTAYVYGSNATTGACCVSSGCFDGTNNQCTAAGGSWTQAGSCDDCVPTCQGDVNADGTIDVLDLLGMLSAWGSCP